MRSKGPTGGYSATTMNDLLNNVIKVSVHKVCSKTIIGDFKTLKRPRLAVGVKINCWDV